MSNKARKNTTARMSREDWDTILAEQTAAQTVSHAAHSGMFGASALAVAAAPVVLYQSAMYDLDLLSAAPVLAVAAAVSMVLLFLSYVSEFRHTSANLARKREDDSSAAAYYTLFISNVLHMAVFSLLAFYVLPKLPFEVPAAFQYAVSVMVASVVVMLRAKRFF